VVKRDHRRANSATLIFLHEATMMRLLYSLAAVALMLQSHSFAASPYVGEQTRTIKALSDQEIADYLSGKGMGFAKAAELNGYPGPSHVLELATELELTPAQKQRTEALFQRMQARASAAGKKLVDEERRLDELFASKAISAASLSTELKSIAALQKEVREAHLEAHLEQAKILSEAQAMKYWHLRGYESQSGSPHHQH
jgi:Spy/CpxP family protein refolding chaperone